MIHELWQAPVNGRGNTANIFRISCEGLFYVIMHKLTKVNAIVHFMEDVRSIRLGLTEI